MQKKYRRMLIMLVYILVVSSTIAYSALTSTLQLNAEAKLRTNSDIRVLGISLSSTNGGTLQYESTYDVNTITSGFVLPTTESSITYKVKVTNNGTIDQTIYDILTQSSNNSGLYYEISGYNVRDVIGFKTVVEFYITYKTTTPSEEPINVVNRFNFKKVYHVTFETNGGTSITDGIKYEGVDLDLSTFTSTKQGYILSGWTDEQAGTTVKYNTNGTYTLDRDLILYAIWEGNPNTSYSVNHYVHDLGTNTYTLDSTDNLTGTTDSTLTLASLKKTIPGFTYVDGYLTGGTTKPTSGAVTTTTILADGSRVINLYYRRNYLYVQYHVNGGSQHSDHGNGWGTSGSLVTLSDSTQFLKGVYGSKVGGVNQSTYVIYTGGLDNYHWDGGMHIVKNGYTAKWLQQWNTLSDGTGTSYDQDGENYDANGFGGADLTTGDKTVTLYVNWEPKYYSITYDLQGGSVVSANPTSYNIESNTITLNNPTLRGYTFLGWTGSNGTTPQTTVTIPVGSTGDKAYIANWTANSYTVTADANGGSIPTTTGWTGTGTTSTKSVTYDSPYGTLPEPTRTGYTFKGWNGKNLFDYQNTKNVTPGITVDENGWITLNTSNNLLYYNYWTYNLDILEDTYYNIAFEIKEVENITYNYINVTSNSSGSGTGQFPGSQVLKKDLIPNTVKILRVKSNTNVNENNGLRTFYTNGNRNSNERMVFRISVYDDDSITPSNFRYEPYYVTSSTNVTQDKNHTLKAKWKMNTYEITYDLQGGTLSTTNPATYNIETNTFTLNNPTLTGYTFTGWTGSNGETPETTVTIAKGSTGDKSYIANWQANSYTVTADANGGSIPSTTGWTGTGATATKSVTYDSPYGTLPTPTRNGYTFKGWNGKNLFETGTLNDYYIYYNSGMNVTISGNTISSIITSGSMSFIRNKKNNYSPGTYTFVQQSTGGYRHLIYLYDSNGNVLTNSDITIAGWTYNIIYCGWFNDNQTITAIIPSTVSYWKYGMVFTGTAGNTKQLSNIQIEKSDIATPYEPYYVTNNVNVTQAKNHTLKAIWDLKESTFLQGQQFNAKIKQLAGNENATYQTSDTNITSIVRSNSLDIMPVDENVVSTSDSNTPTYAWFDSNTGILYYYTDAVNLYMNANAQVMFYDLRSVTGIDLSDINTSRTTNMQSLFNNDYSLTSVDVSNFNTSNVTTMFYMFYNCTALTSVDVSNFNTTSVRSMSHMFRYAGLQSLDISSFDMSNVTNTANMLTNMTSLESLKTPDTYPTDSSVKITLPKLMIDSNGNEYTELNSSSPTETMLYTPATFLPGQEFNAKIKQLAGNQDATYNTTDTNITSIVRSDTLGITPTDDNIVSTSDSNTPIYAWYDNGTIYYYTEEENPYMNTNASFMFYYLLNVTSIDISDVKTSNTNNMYSMFYNCRSLETIDVSNFNTSKVTNMSQMFAVNRALTTLDLSSFNTSNVTEMAAMFRYCNSLKELDLSKFDMTKVTNANLMITDLPVLESLKTPNTYPSEAVIQLPKTLYDPSGNGWSVLDSSAPTETWLHKMVCKRATTLHTETCSQTSDSLYCSGAGYKVGGSKNTSTITYGSLGTNATTLNSGDAFTCDVNGDGTFNELTERFYYVGDYYNTTTKEFETDTGVLIYYNNVSGGTPNNTATSEYDTSGENWHGPVTAITQLPTTSQWTNISLKNNTRAILTYNTTNLTAGGTLPSDFSYSGYSARLLTVQEINNATGKNNVYQRLDDVAPYLFENTIYSTPSYDNRWWVENSNTNSISALSIYTSISENSGYTNGLYGDTVLGMHGVRPAIEVNKNFLNKKVNAYLITYDTNGGSENTTQTVTVGDSLGSLSVPTKEGYTFNGWYTAASGGEEVTTATVPTATTTYYAHWTPIDYNITYDLDGGTVTTNNPSTYNADSNAITLDNPTRNGYTFAGWSGGKEIKQGLPSDTAAANTTSRTFTTPLLVKGLAFNNYYYPSNVSSYSINNNSINIVGRSGYGVGFALLCEPNTDYTISYTSTVGEGASPEVGITYYARDGSLIKYRVNQSGGNQSLTTTSTSDSYYVVISFGVNATNFASITYSNISLSGTTDTIPYEGYVDKQTTITIPSGSVGNRKYTANWTANSYTVTADANGGSMPSTNGWTGTGNTATKSVTYDSQYGTLPTPTRNGYTFKGWNGKNLFNEMKKGVRIYPDNGEETADQDYASTNYISVDFSNGNSYYLSGLTNKLRSFIAVYDANKEFLGRTSGITRTEILLDSTSIQAFKTFDVTQAKYIRIQQYFNGTNSIDEIDNLSIQLEEGTTATPYEPYYVTSSTNVTQDKNHTLKAIWEMNTYEITYDLQGGTLASSNPATYNVETNTFTLNNPTLTGQTFIGWTGSNGNTPEVNVTIPVGSYGDKAYVAHFSPIYEPETRIRSLNTIGTSIADDDPDSNLRFIGSNPNNYVSFNGQKWRIIGVFDGKLKIIGDSIGKYSWDTSRNTVNNGYGINQWGVSGTYTGADLMKLLNPGYESNKDLKCNTTVTITDGVANCGDNTDSNYTTGLVNNSLYWNASSGYCYNYGNYKTTSCDFSTSGLKSDAARNMIDNATWYLGGNLASDNIWDGRMTASYLYNIERSNNTGKQCSGGDYCNDDVTRTTTWQGKVGLLYPSDYIYATSGGSTYNRNTCLTVHAGNVSDNSVSNWNNTYTDCKNNDWLLPSSLTWSLSPRAHSSGSNNVFYVDTTGYVSNISAMYAVSVRPVVYLKSSIKLTSGDGSYNSPFNLIDTE